MDYTQIYNDIMNMLDDPAIYEELATYTNNINDLKPELRKGARVFYYRKLDGSLRRAKGTLDFTKIPASKWPKGLRTPPPHVFTYYDLEKNNWRCFWRTLFIGITIY